jgi:hypothetical protein
MGSFGRAKEIQGYRHILTFSDGPRICLGKSFALAEFKVNYLAHTVCSDATNPLPRLLQAVLSVLIRNYSFDLPDGTKIKIHPSILPRPKVVGEIGARVPMKVKRID